MVFQPSEATSLFDVVVDRKILVPVLVFLFLIPPHVVLLQ